MRPGQSHSHRFVPFMEGLNVIRSLSKNIFHFHFSFRYKAEELDNVGEFTALCILMIILLVARCLATQQLQPGLTTVKAWRSQSSIPPCTRGLTRPRFSRPHLHLQRRSTPQSTTSLQVVPTMCTGIKFSICLCLWPVAELFANYESQFLHL